MRMTHKQFWEAHWPLKAQMKVWRCHVWNVSHRRCRIGTIVFKEAR